MSDERSKEEQKRAKREANRVDVGGPVKQMPHYIGFPVYENKVDQEQLIPKLKQFLVDLMPLWIQVVAEIVRNSTSTITSVTPDVFVESPLHVHTVSVQRWAEVDILLDRPYWAHFRMKTVVGILDLFTIHLIPDGNQTIVLIRGWDMTLVDLYKHMFERLVYAFPPTPPVSREEQLQEQASQPQEDAVAKHEPLKANQWLFKQYFDFGNKNYENLKTDWLHIRQAQDYKEPPTDPIKSMKQAIREESIRRNARNHQE